MVTKKKPTYKIPKGARCRLLLLSTCHMSERDDEMLDDFGHGFSAAREGWFFNLACLSEVGELEEKDLSDSLKTTIRVARQLGFDFLRFDCDAPVIKGFPIGSWS